MARDHGTPYTPPDRIVLEAGRREITQYSRQSWYRLEKAGKVPKRIKLGQNKVGWLESELLAWVRSRAALRDQAAGGPEAELEAEPSPVPRRRRRRVTTPEAEPCHRPAGVAE